MYKRLLGLIPSLLILSAMSAVSLAQDSEEPCSTRETVYPVVKTVILEEAGYHGVRVRYAAAGERLDIIGSLRVGPRCWLQVSDGWLISSGRALSSEPPSESTAQPVTDTRGCYRSQKAFVVGNMNIRSDASATSQVVANARAGDVFAVSASTSGTDWCWLKIERGWMAKTGRVRSTKPAQPVVTGVTTPAASEPTKIDNCCFVDRQCATDKEWENGYWAFQNNQCGSQSSQLSGPHHVIIDGSPPFVAEIKNALDMMRDRAPNWYQYVVEATDRIFENPNSHIANAYSSTRTISIRPYDHRWWAGYSREQRLISLASSLQHEACHIHRHHAGFPYNAYTKVSEEVACIALHSDMSPAIDPNRIGRDRPVVGLQHCEGSLENHPRCREFDVCEWAADRSRVISCPEIGLTRPND